jgi:uncharacterized protein (DUF302 family)
MNISIAHNSVAIGTSFENFTRQFESQLGYFDQAILNEIGPDPIMAKAAIEKMQGAEGLMLFTVLDHGRVLTMVGINKQAKQYRVGNPLIAMQMTQHDVRAGLYVPLSILIYENTDGKVIADYDLPTSILGQFGNKDIDVIAAKLNQKLFNLIKLSDN